MNERQSATNEYVLEAIELAKRYEDGVLAVDNLSFGVAPGQIFTMLGGNGAGKSTTINMFLNFIEPTSGKALIAGIDSNAQPLDAKQHVAYVSENVMLYTNFTAMQNIEFFSRLSGKKKYIRDDFHQVLRRVGLPDEVHHKRLRGFSKGMRQRCGIAIAILKDAPVILLDEPTAGLDPQAGHDFVELLSALRTEGKAVLMSTHDIFRAREISDVVAIMHRGKLIMQQTAEELADQDLEQLYLNYMAGSRGLGEREVAA